MSDLKALDLSAVKSIPVHLGNREFRLKQDTRAVVAQVFAVAYGGRDEAEEKPFVEALFSNWEDSLGVFTIILGDDTPATRAFLEEHLTVPAAISIFNAWWELNGLEDLTIRGGRLLMPPGLVKSIEASRQAIVEEALAEVNRE